MDDGDVIEIVICDDHPAFARGLANLMEAEAEDIRVVGVAITVGEVYEIVSESRPDVVLMDVRMPEGGGIEATRRIRALSPSTKVVMLTVSDEYSDLTDSLRAGAAGYVLKDKEADGIAGAVRSAYHEQLVIPSHLAEDFTSRSESESDLSDEEASILLLVARGATNQAVASRLNLGERTVKRRLASIYDKLGLAGRREAIIYAWQHGLGPREKREGDEA